MIKEFPKKKSTADITLDLERTNMRWLFDVRIRHEEGAATMSVAIEQMLENLKSLTEIDELSFDENGKLELVFDGEIPLDVRKVGGDRVVLTTPIASAVQELSFEELAEYLQGNYFGDATGHGAIVYHEEDDTLLLRDEFDASLFDVKRLETRLVDFIKYASFWLSDRSERMASPEEETTTAAPFQSSPEDFFIRG